MALLTRLDDLPADPAQATAYDLVVIGAGGAGLSAALHAAIDGAKVLVVERSEFVGGTTALSAGTTWIPGTRHCAPGADSLEQAERYLDAVVGPHSAPALRRAFLQAGAEAVERFEQHTEVHYRPYALHPDYQSEQPGSTLRGRALEPLPFDGRQLGHELFAVLRAPIPEFTLLGGMMVDRTDINHLLALGRSFKSFRHALKIIGRHAIDRLSHPRGTRLVMGNALVGRLLLSLAKRPNVSLLLRTELQAVHRDAGGVEAVTLGAAGQGDGPPGGAGRRVNVRGGLVLASGGFNRHPQWRAERLPGIETTWCPGAPGHTGQAQQIALGLGARFGSGGASEAFWAPVSLRQRVDGSTAVFPHFVMDRAKPGVITVNQAGERFVNESTSYHLFGLAMQAAHQHSPAVPAWLVCDAAALARYGLGMVRPGGKGLAPYLADGYLTQGATLDDLASRTGMDPARLQAAVAQNNANAERGEDTVFQRGVTAYQRNIGDAAWPGRNPNLGPIATGPFYAVKVYPGDIGAATGLASDEHARVLDEAGAPIAGLYAVGNDMHSIMGGTYPGPGITIGPGMVFARIAARDALGRVS
jgi:succinate dehydrogenase/fumarate reductase flavoprotein subunit